MECNRILILKLCILVKKAMDVSAVCFHARTGQASGAWAVLSEDEAAARARMDCLDLASQVVLEAALACRKAVPDEAASRAVLEAVQGDLASQGILEVVLACREAGLGEAKAVCEKTQNGKRNDCMAGKGDRICLCMACNFHHMFAATASIKHDWTYGKSLFILSYAG
jgi:hypothetical protein